MITQRVLNYVKVLDSLQLEYQLIEKTEKLLLSCRELTEVLENPAIKKKEKHAVIEVLFEKEIVSFMKLLCDHGLMSSFKEIKKAYEDLMLEHRNMVKAKLCYTVRPHDSQLEQIKNMLCEKYNKKGVFLELEEDASLIGGFVLYIGGTEFDKSIKGALSELQKKLIGR